MLVPGRSQLDEFIEATSAIHSKERLFELFIAAMVAMGFDMVNFSIMYDTELDVRHWGFGLISTYPLDWQGYYMDRRLHLIDPVRRRAWGLAPPFWWREIGRQEKLTRNERAFFRDAEAAGLYNGLGIPFRGPALQRSGVALATSIKRLIIPDNLDTVVLIATHFYSVYKRICKATVKWPTANPLSETEREILVRCAHGRTDAEIAMLMNMKPDNVNYHWRRIFVLLDVNNRTHAVAFALHNGLMEL